MSNSTQVAIVRRLYEARGNPEVIRQVLALDVRWEVVEGFPYSGVYVGLDDVLRNFFGRLFSGLRELRRRGHRVLRVRRPRHRPRQLCGACQKDRQAVYRAFRSCVDLARWVDRAVATVCRYRAAGSCPGR
jgi:hypothetical protein